MADCGCEFEARDATQRRVLRTLLGINAAMFGVELVIGLLAQSSGVLADSLDMLADALVYGVALFATGHLAAAKRRAAWLSGVLQVAIGLGVLLEIARRAVWGSEPVSMLMFAVSVVALAANAVCLRLIARHRDGEIHMRASWIFSRNDVLANLGVILASVLVYASDSRWPDIVVGLAITGLVTHGGLTILRETRAPA